MSVYQYTFKYRTGAEIEVTDALPRLPVPSYPKSEGSECFSVWKHHVQLKPLHVMANRAEW